MISFFRRLLFEKKPVSIESDFDLPESVRRLSAIVRPWPYLSLRQGLIGRVSSDKVHVSRVIPLLNYNLHGKPVLHGVFRESGGKVAIEGYIAIGLIARLFFSVILGIFSGAFCLSIPLTIYLFFHPPGKLVGASTITLIANLLPIPIIFLAATALLALNILFEQWLARNDQAFITERIQGALHKPEKEVLTT